MSDLTPEQVQAALSEARARRDRLARQMTTGVSQVTNADGSGLRYESSSERAKALRLVDDEIARLERQTGRRRRRAQVVYYGGGKGI